MAEYKGRHIVKHEKKNGITVETYVEFEEGQVYLNTYVNFKLYSRIHVADLASKDIAADVVPEKHGHWIKIGNFAFKCTSCGKVYWDSKGYAARTHFCPNSGAKMDGGKSDE